MGSAVYTRVYWSSKQMLRQLEYKGEECKYCAELLFTVIND